MKPRFTEKSYETSRIIEKAIEINNRLNNISKKVADNKLNNLPDFINATLISVSYNMGWNKRGGDRVYDSLSGNGFLIGCKSDKIITFGVQNKLHYMLTKQYSTTTNHTSPLQC